MSYKILQLDQNETVVLEVRKHWIVFVRHIATAFIFAVVPNIAFQLLLDFAPTKLTEIIGPYQPAIFFFYYLWLLFIWLVLFVQWTNYYLDVWFVTTSRIINAEQKGIFHREVSNVHFDRIQDVSVEVKGIYATFLKYGTVRVQTAAQDSTDYVMSHAAHPDNVRKVLFDLHNARKNKLHAVDGAH
jgi:uncharacterized membrane protein YdbT with pleckstrin-like domain